MRRAYTKSLRKSPWYKLRMWGMGGAIRVAARFRKVTKKEVSVLKRSRAAKIGFASMGRVLGRPKSWRSVFRKGSQWRISTNAWRKKHARHIAGLKRGSALRHRWGFKYAGSKPREERIRWQRVTWVPGMLDDSDWSGRYRYDQQQRMLRKSRIFGRKIGALMGLPL